MHQPQCNKCGRFVNLDAPGVSWSRSHTWYDLHDPSYRCSPCTDRFGIAESNCNPKNGPWSGRNPTSAQEGE